MSLSRSWDSSVPLLWNVQLVLCWHISARLEVILPCFHTFDAILCISSTSGDVFSAVHESLDTPGNRKNENLPDVVYLPAIIGSCRTREVTWPIYLLVRGGWSSYECFKLHTKKIITKSLLSTPSERQNTAYCFTSNNSEHCGVVCVSQYAYETKMFRPVYLACGLGMWYFSLLTLSLRMWLSDH